MSRQGWVLAALAGAALGALAMWLGGESSRGTDRARIEAVVHEYVLAHPEIIPEAMQRLQDRETGKVIAANRAAIVDPFGSAWAGNPKGDVTVVEYLDYACTYCRASLPVVAALIAADRNVRVVYRELPVLSEESRVAARMSLAAAEQGRFQAFHDTLYGAGPLTPDTLAAAARTAGIDDRRAAALVPRAEAMVRDNLLLAQRLGMTGTPTWVVGDRVLSGLQPLADLQKAVAAARATS